MSRKMITIKGPVDPGTLIPRPPRKSAGSGVQSRESRFYNFPADWIPPKRDKLGNIIEKAERIRGVAFGPREVPDDDFHRDLVKQGAVEIVEAKTKKPTGGDK